MPLGAFRDQATYLSYVSLLAQTLDERFRWSSVVPLATPQRYVRSTLIPADRN